MDDTDIKILHELQDNFPLKERPYDIIAEMLQIPVGELLDRIQRLLDDGVIRRLGASFDSNKLGFSSTLAAVRIEPARIEQAAEIIGHFPEVTHSYLRKDVFNIWFTIIAVDGKKIDEILEQIRISLNLDKLDVLNLPVKQLFKLDARFHIR